MLRAVLSLCAIVLAFAANPAEAQGRKALVVGIGEYASLPPVVRSSGDASAMQEELQRLGFEAELVLDATAADLEGAFARFVSGLQRDDLAVVYFSGHSTGWPGDYLLLPTDAPAQGASREEIRSVGGIGLHVVAEQIRAAGARAQVLFVDACRGDPYAASQQGLAPSTCGDAGRQMPEGSFVLFSASAGQRALDRLSEQDQDPHSLFTRVLLRRLPEVSSVVRLARVVRDEVVESAASVNWEQRPAYLDELVGPPVRLVPRERAPREAAVPPERLPPQREAEPLPAPEPAPRRRAAFQCGSFEPGPPAFDCRSARTAVEIAICRDPRLGSCDRALNDVFEQAQGRLGRRAPALRVEQDRWLPVRDACAREGRAGFEAVAECVGRVYDKRIAELARIGEADTTASVPRAPVSPSFDCRYARTSVERSICADPALASLDREMAALFGEALNRAPARALEADQNDWRAERDACARSGRSVEPCVEDAYRNRIRELRAIVAGR